MASDEAGPPRDQNAHWLLPPRAPAPTSVHNLATLCPSGSAHSAVACSATRSREPRRCARRGGGATDGSLHLVRADVACTVHRSRQVALIAQKPRAREIDAELLGNGVHGRAARRERQRRRRTAVFLERTEAGILVHEVRGVRLEVG